MSVRMFGRRSVDLEAASWVARLNSDHWSEADQTALREWCRRSPANRDALRRLGTLWAELDDLSTVQVEAQPPSVGNALHWNRFWVAHAAVFGLVAVALAMGIWWMLNVNVSTPAVQFYATSIGEQRTIELSDHSTVQMNTNSVLEVSYRPLERRVRLVRGEALFNVRKDAARPFLVNAGIDTVRAVGTRFAVRLRNADVIEVVVSEGAVKLMRSAEAPSSSEQVSAPVVRKDQVAIVRDLALDPVSVTTVNGRELDRRLAWTGAFLEFDGESLEQVVAEVSRYTPVKIAIADPQLRKVPVGGRFRVGDTQALFDVIEAGFGARVTYTKDGVVITRQ
jgi:transmembrane sensor